MWGARNGWDFDAEAKKVFAQLNLPPSGDARLGGGRSAYNNLDPIWRHPNTGAFVYVGNITAAETLSILQEHKITHVVNCQGLGTSNKFEGREGFRYLRFPVASWFTAPNVQTHQGVLDYFAPVLSFVDEATSRGHSVLVHCLAGAHRAGTTGVAIIMHKTRAPKNASIQTAKQCRPIINPIGHLVEILDKLEDAIKDQDARLKQ